MRTIAVMLAVACSRSTSPIETDALRRSPDGTLARHLPRWRGVGVRLALALAILITAVSPVYAQDSLSAFDCQRAGFPAGTPSSAATCGWIAVAEHAANSDPTRTVQIAVAVAHATAAAPDPAEAIVFLQGGPGASIVEDTAALSEVAFGDAARTRDVVVIDQRGTGLSDPSLGCPEVAAFSREQAATSISDDDAYESTFLNTLAACVERLRASADLDLSTVNSTQSAADVIAVLHTLGYHRLDLYGLSYGARLALSIVRDYGATGEIRSATLGGVYGTEADALQVPVGLAERLDLLFDACAADDQCNATYGDLRAKLGVLMARPEHTAMLEALLDALGSTDGISSVPKLISSAAPDDEALIADGIKARQMELNSLAWGMNAAVQCQEEFLIISPEELAADAAAVPRAYTGLALRFPESSSAMPGWCAQQGFGARPAAERQPVSSGTVPVLAISGEFDPFTPPEWAERATSGFSKRYLITLRSAGHDTALASACPISIVAAFIADPSVAPDMSCANVPVQFQL